MIWGDFQERVVGINTKEFQDGDDLYTLSVNGKVRATEVKVYTGWADYVFEEDYDLRSLEEVEAYIREQYLAKLPPYSYYLLNKVPPHFSAPLSSLKAEG